MRTPQKFIGLSITSALFLVLLKDFTVEVLWLYYLLTTLKRGRRRYTHIELEKALLALNTHFV
jgi:hypothetical protein